MTGFRFLLPCYSEIIPILVASLHTKRSLPIMLSTRSGDARHPSSEPDRQRGPELELAGEGTEFRRGRERPAGEILLENDGEP